MPDRRHILPVTPTRAIQGDRPHVQPFTGLWIPQWRSPEPASTLSNQDGPSSRRWTPRSSTSWTAPYTCRGLSPSALCSSTNPPVPVQPRPHASVTGPSQVSAHSSTAHSTSPEPTSIQPGPTRVPSSPQIPLSGSNPREAPDMTTPDNAQHINQPQPRTDRRGRGRYSTPCRRRQTPCQRHMTVPKRGHKRGHKTVRRDISYSERRLRQSRPLTARTAWTPPPTLPRARRATSEQPSRIDVAT